MNLIFQDIQEERIRQAYLWGIQNHSWSTWLLILGEEYGEACKAVIEANAEPSSEDVIRDLREELIHVAAVAVQIIEHIDRETNDNTLGLSKGSAGVSSS